MHVYVVCEMMAIKLKSWCEKFTFKFKRLTVWFHLILDKGFTDEKNIKFQNFLNTLTDYCLIR